MELNTILHGDCLKVMKTFPDNSVDLVVTSPPYNMRLRIRNGEYCEREREDSFSVKYDHFHDAYSMEDYFEFSKQALIECLRVSPLVFYNVQFLTGNKVALFRLMGAFSQYIKDVIMWDKVVAQPAMHEGVLNSQFEVILVLDRVNSISREFTRCNFDRGTMSNVWRLDRVRRETSTHRASFPISLATKIIENFSKEGDLVLDPFNGTGTTCLAALVSGRNYVGIDIAKHYCNVAERRISDYLQQLNLFE